MKKITVRSKIKNFDIYFVDDFVFVDELAAMENATVIVGDKLYPLYKNKIFHHFPKSNVLIIPLGEKNKTIETALKIYKKLLNKPAKKNMTIISFGGGINQDVVGFAASTLYRGMKWIFIPTTLLAMIDSAIGLKTSLNFHSYKNVLGSFYPPSKIFINTDFLQTLTKIDYLSGVGETIKFYLMKKDALQDIDATVKKIDILIQAKNREKILGIIREGIAIKYSYMEGDEFDMGKRNLLNYGHELGHALESASLFAVPHGIGVMIGIIFANSVAVERGWLRKSIFDEINRKLLLPNIPRDVIILKKIYFGNKIILENMKKDKKRISEALPLVLPKNNSLELCKIQDLGQDELRKNLNILENILL